MRAGIGEGLDNTEPDAARAASDECHLAVETKEILNH